MDFYNVIESRRTTRDFTNETISDKVIERIIKAGMSAPTNDHMRDWHFIIIKDHATVRHLIEHIPMSITDTDMDALIHDWNLTDTCQQNCYKNAVPKQYRMFSDASCMIIPLLKQKTDILHPDNISHLNGFASIWCCIENILLAATAENYGCSLRIPLGNEDTWAREVLKFPSDYFMPCFLGLGKPAPNATPVKQHPYNIADHIHQNTW